jgi:hypothetical protein
MQIRRFGTSDHDYVVTEKYSGLLNDFSDRTLQAHDGEDDILFVGIFNQDGSLRLLDQPVVAVPIRPSNSYAMEQHRKNGSVETIRRWAGSSSLDLPAGRFNVEIYSDANKQTGVTYTAAYADQVGLVALGALTGEGTLLFACSLTKVHDI